MAIREKRTTKKPYLQWSKKQSGVVTAFFMLYFVFIALCVVYQPKASDALVSLAMAVAGVMGANLAAYGGTSSFEKYIAGKYGDFMQYKKGNLDKTLDGVVDDEDDETESTSGKNSEEDKENG